MRPAKRDERSSGLFFLEVMTKAEKTNKLRELLGPVVENNGAFLVDVNLRGERSSQLVEVFCDTEAGITIDKCAQISRMIMPIIESSDVMEWSYRLEVSSPGVGSAIKDRRQYKSNLGRLVEVKYTKGADLIEIEGDLRELRESGIVLDTATGSVELDFDSIIEARVKIRW